MAATPPNALGHSTSIYLCVDMEFIGRDIYHDIAKSGDELEDEINISACDHPPRTTRSRKGGGDKEAVLLYWNFFLNVLAYVMVPFTKIHNTALIHQLRHASFCLCFHIFKCTTN